MISGWGKYPETDRNPRFIESVEDLRELGNSADSVTFRGNGRSYGDSSLGKFMAASTRMNRIHAFDQSSGLLTCDSGVLPADIIQVFLPQGWFPPVVPGTKFITVGGAIAADIHGKNHHQKGCFSEFVDSFELVLSDNERLICSPKLNTELFRATCGGMGLTGFISTVKLRLMKVNSAYINQSVLCTNSLDDTFNRYESISEAPYSVAWLDLASMSENMGRAVITTGDFSEREDLDYRQKRAFNLPRFTPSILLNRYSLRAFNRLYYLAKSVGSGSKTVTADDFFFPLDGCANWNLLYGKNGLLQYHFIFPENKSFDAINRILKILKDENQPCYLAVLKKHGKQNKNYLSFPMKGYSLAMDFPNNEQTRRLMDHFFKILADFDGRIYLAKDAVARPEIIHAGYDKLKLFKEVRKKYNCTGRFESLQSRRLNL